VFLLGDLVSFELLVRLLVAALLWVLLHHLIRFHPRGIEIVGAIVAGVGLLWWMGNPTLIPSGLFGAFLFLLGFGVYAIGRLLYRFKRNDREHPSKDRSG
jgi:hypothetical protein